MHKSPSVAAFSQSKSSLGPAVAVLLLMVFTGQLLRVAHLYSANWDESHHLYDGYNILTTGDYRSNAEVPPLVKLAAALPLLSLHPSLPPDHGSSHTTNAFLDGRTFVFSNGGDRLLFPARVVCMLFTLLTALLLYLSGRKLFGATAGICALLLFTFDPNVLAHGTLISTDMASACFLFATVYTFYRYHLDRNWRWLLITGVLAGLAMSAKFTGILIAPMLILLAVAEGIRNGSLASFAKSLSAAIAALIVGWAVIWAFYGFRYAPAPGGLQLSPALGPYLASLPNPSDGVKLALAARFHLLPQAYIWGLANTKHTEWEYMSYFWGRVHRHGPWQYFPAAFLIKSTLPLLALLLLAPLTMRNSGKKYGREFIFLLIPVVVYFAVVMNSTFCIGARHLMPVYPFLYIIAGAAAATLMRRGPAWTAVAALLLVWQAFTTIRVAPNYMAYGNELWGGPLQVRNYLSDANVDWGQQLKTVKQYLDQNHITNCWFAYFPDGAVQPQDYDIHCQRLPTPSGLWWLNLPMNVPPEIEGTVLISESDLDGVESGDGVLNPYDSFRREKPVAILQDGVYVYQGKFAVPLASAWVDIRRSQELAKAGHTDEALGLAHQAAALVPDSARAQLQLADALAAQQHWDEALVHYRLAQSDLQRQRPDLQGEELGPAIQTGLNSAESHRK